MDAKLRVHKLAMNHRKNVVFVFAGTFCAGLLFMWLAGWAEYQRGWEASILQFICIIVGGLALLTSLFIGVLVYQSFSLYNGAIGSAEWYERDPEALLRAYKEVVGPIPWK